MAEPTEDTTRDTDGEIAVERTAVLAVPPDAVWDAITDPALLTEWFGPVEFDLRPDGPVTITESGETRTIGVVDNVERPARIGFVWIAPDCEAPSSVEIVIDDDGSGGSILHTREVRLGTDWDRRPAWFAPSASASASARASARARA